MLKLIHNSELFISKNYFVIVSAINEKNHHPKNGRGGDFNAIYSIV